MNDSNLDSMDNHLTDAPVPLKWMRRFRYMSDMFDQITDVPGDIVECGVGDGSTFSMLAYLAGRENGPHVRALHGFDSFEGFPEPDASDASWRVPQKGEWSIDEAEVHTRLEVAGVKEMFPNLDVALVKGFFADTLPKEEEYLIALLHADGDIYPSYHDTLTHFYPRVSSGGLVLFDEYKEFKPNKEGEKWPGATKAIDEYFAPLGLEPVLHEETGKYYIIKP